MKRGKEYVFGFLVTILLTALSRGYAEVTPADLRQTIRDYIAQQEKLQGAFVIVDERTQTLRQLELVRVHQRVGKTGDYYYSCTDMRDVRSGELLDLDFDIAEREGALEVAAIRIHKDDGIPRYTYNDKDERIPVPVAILKGTDPGSSLRGKVSFLETDEGMKINAVVFKAPPGKHGFHIHENGSCEDAGKAAGGHFNPDGTPHGYLPQDGFQKAHAGDLGNIEIGPDGKGTLELVIPGLTFREGKYAVAGRSVILHAKEDDFGQPTGNAGSRLGCAVIPTEA